MSLCPYILSDQLMAPSRVLDQHFGLPLEPEHPLAIPRMLMRCPAGYWRNWLPIHSQKDSGSTVTFEKDKFQASLDVQQFKPDEISVRITGDNTVTIEGKHEEKPDEHGLISRHFVRKYVLPKNCDIQKVESKLSSDGVLTITAPIQTAEKAIEQKEIPVVQTGKPAKPIEKKTEEVKQVEEKK